MQTEFIWVGYIILSYNETSESYSYYSTYWLLSFPADAITLHCGILQVICRYAKHVKTNNIVRSTGHFLLHVGLVCVCVQPMRVFYKTELQSSAFFYAVG